MLDSNTNPPNANYRVYLDIKDTRGKERLNQLEFFLDKAHRGNSPYSHFQHIHSSESEFLQLTDLIIGAITYKTREEHKKKGASVVKRIVLEHLEKKSGYSLSDGTIPWEQKFNIFDFEISSSNESFFDYDDTADKLDSLEDLIMDLPIVDPSNDQLYRLYGVFLRDIVKTLLS